MDSGYSLQKLVQAYFDCRQHKRTTASALRFEADVWEVDPVLVTAFMVQANGGFNTTPARNLQEPVSTVTTTGSQQQLAVASWRSTSSARMTRPAPCAVPPS